MTYRVSVVCERVRSQVAADLDGELSQIERAMLAAHLGRCAACRAYEADVRAYTLALREAPLERMETPVAVRRRQRRVAVVRIPTAAAAAAAVAVIAVGVATDQSLDSHERGRALGVEVVRFPTQAELERELTLISFETRLTNNLRGGKTTAR